MLNARVLPLHMQSPRNGFSPRKSFSSSPVGTLKRSHKTPTKAPALDLAGAGIIDGSALIERGGVRSRDEIDSRESERSQTAWGGGDLGPMLDSSAAAAPDAIDSIDIFSPTSPPSPLSERGGGQPLSQPAGFVQGRIPQRSVAPPMRGGNPTQVGGGAAATAAKAKKEAKQSKKRAELMSAFAMFDQDGSGAISVSELAAILGTPVKGKPTLSAEEARNEAEAIIAKYDTNGGAWKTAGAQTMLASDLPPHDQ